MRKIRWLLSIFLLLCAGAGIYAFLHLGQWLELDEPLRQSKAIVVMGGGIPFRAMEAADLYKAHWADQIWLTTGADNNSGQLALARIGMAPDSEEETNHLVLTRLGVPPEAICVIPEHVDNTLAEEKAILHFVGPGSRAPVILVTSKFHTRRTRVIWNLIAGKAPVIVRYTAEEDYDAARWWRNSTDALATIKELFGILNAWAGFPISPREH